MKFFGFILAITLCWLVYSTITGRNGLIDYYKQQELLAQAQQTNQMLLRRNQLVQDEIYDLTQGNLSIEEIARSELGMIKSNETFYRVIKTHN